MGFFCPTIRPILSLSTAPLHSTFQGRRVGEKQHTCPRKQGYLNPLAFWWVLWISRSRVGPRTACQNQDAGDATWKRLRMRWTGKHSGCISASPSHPLSLSLSLSISLSGIWLLTSAQRWVLTLWFWCHHLVTAVMLSIQQWHIHCSFKNAKLFNTHCWKRQNIKGCGKIKYFILM